MAASTLMSSSTISLRGTMTMNPAVAFKALEMYTQACCSPVRRLTSGTSSAVRKPMLQMPARGYWIITTLRKELD